MGDRDPRLIVLKPGERLYAFTDEEARAVLSAIACARSPIGNSINYEPPLLKAETRLREGLEG